MKKQICDRVYALIRKQNYSHTQSLLANLTWNFISSMDVFARQTLIINTLSQSQYIII